MTMVEGYKVKPVRDGITVEEAIKFPQWYNFDTQLEIMEAVKESGQRFYDTALGTVTIAFQQRDARYPTGILAYLNWDDGKGGSVYSPLNHWPLFSDRRLIQRAIDLDLFAGKLDLLKYCSAASLGLAKERQESAKHKETYFDQLSMIFELGVRQYRDANREQDAIQWVRDTLAVERVTGPDAAEPSKEMQSFYDFFTEQAERVGLRI